LILAVISRGKRSAGRTVCINNAHQINLAVIMYADEHQDMLRGTTNNEPLYYSYKESILPYLARNESGPADRLFICPADDFNCDDKAIKDLFLFYQVSGKMFCHQPVTHNSSYFFNGDAANTDDPRLGGGPFAMVKQPSRFVLVGELSGAFGLGAHDRKQPYQYSNAMSVMSFVDGHVGFIPMYWNGVRGFDGIPGLYEPLAGYDYEWMEK